MTQSTCPHCQSALPQEKAIRFCPFCGKPIAETATRAPSALAKRLAGEKNPKRKYAMIMEALAQSPDDFAANEALLYHGRLHEVAQKGAALDFSKIKCHLLHVFHAPEAYDAARREARLTELFADPQLQRTMALAPDADAFFSEYLQTLAFMYIDLFIRGDSRNSSFLFGFARSHDAQARRCAEPVNKILENIRTCDCITAAQGTLLLCAVRDGYARAFPGYEACLA